MFRALSKSSELIQSKTPVDSKSQRINENQMVVRKTRWILAERCGADKALLNEVKSTLVK